MRLISSTIDYLRNREKIQIIRSYTDLDRNKVNILLGVEGGHIFDGTFKQFEALYGLGVRVFTLTWNNSNRLAHSGLEADRRGLTNKGRRFLKRIEDYDVILDLSHASTRTALNVCDACSNQVIASHSCVRALNQTFPRNIDDCVVKAISKKGFPGYFVDFSSKDRPSGANLPLLQGWVSTRRVLKMNFFDFFCLRGRTKA